MPTTTRAARGAARAGESQQPKFCTTPKRLKPTADAATLSALVTNTNDASYIGAERPTNYTAELTAVARALEHVCADQSGRPALIRYDSLYAGRIATGAWWARTN